MDEGDQNQTVSTSFAIKIDHVAFADGRLELTYRCSKTMWSFMKRAAFLTAATVLAWVPSLRPYTPRSDDLEFLLGIGHYFGRWGVWRIVGHLPAMYTNHYPFAVLGLLGHVAAVLVIYYALSKIVGNDRALFAGTVI